MVEELVARTPFDDSAEAPLPAFQIVPLQGLPIVAAAIASNRLWALDFFHVVGGGLWTASTCSSAS